MEDTEELSLEEIAVSTIFVQASKSVEQAKKTIKETHFGPTYLTETKAKSLYIEILEDLKNNEIPNEMFIGKRLTENPAIKAAGGFLYVMHVLTHCCTDASIGSIIEEVKRTAVRRKLEWARSLLSNAALSENTENIQAIVENIQALEGDSDKSLINTGFEVLDKLLEELENGDAVPLPTGYPSLDQVISGWQNALNVIAGHPGIGKSALMAGSIYSSLKAGKKIGLVSLEDPGHWIMSRILSHVSGISMHRIRHGRCSAGETKKMMDKICEAGQLGEALLVYDGEYKDINTILSVMKQMVDNKVCGIFVDHLGEFERPGKEARDVEVGYICRKLRGITSKYKIPVILAAHLAGDEGNRIAHSKEIDRIARVILKVFQDEDEENQVNVFIDKQNNGPVPRRPLVLYRNTISALLEEK